MTRHRLLFRNQGATREKQSGAESPQSKWKKTPDPADLFAPKRHSRTWAHAL
jgi:hypothetical protein